MHIGIDLETQKIVAGVVTESSVGDSKVTKPLLDQIPGQILFALAIFKIKELTFQNKAKNCNKVDKKIFFENKKTEAKIANGLPVLAYHLHNVGI